MFITYVAVTLVATALVGAAAVANLAGSDYSKAQADINRVPRSWVRPLGLVLAGGALGLLAGFAVPALGIVAAAGLVLYFVCAFVVHVRASNYQLGPWVMYASLAVAALVINLTRLVH
ncbi:MAG: DoxX family protein [Mycobacterium sp.]|uniref:DoxX family protein n=1 Tax=Mycobacterium sp. TaxID=1785 RepID=UPI003C5BBFB6